MTAEARFLLVSLGKKQAPVGACFIRVAGKARLVTPACAREVCRAAA